MLNFSCLRIFFLTVSLNYRLPVKKTALIMMKGHSIKEINRMLARRGFSSYFLLGPSRLSLTHAHTRFSVLDSCEKVVPVGNFAPSRRAITWRRTVGGTLSSIMERMGHIRRG